MVAWDGAVASVFSMAFLHNSKVALVMTSLRCARAFLAHGRAHEDVGIQAAMLRPGGRSDSRCLARGTGGPAGRGLPISAGVAEMAQAVRLGGM